MRRIGVIATGGTVAATGEGSLLTPTLHPDEIMAHINPIESSIEVAVIREFTRAMSSEMSLVEMVALSKASVALADEFDLEGVVVLHGTATLLQSAFVAYLLNASEAPIVFTGSIEPISAVGSDAVRNIRDSIHAAAHPRLRGARSIVVFDGVIHNPRYARKAHTTAFGAIDASHYATLGYCDRGQPVVHHRAFHPPPLVLGSRDPVSTPIVKAVVGLEPAGFTAFASQLAAGSALVVECFPGSGAVPASWSGEIEAAITDGLSVIFASEPPGPISPRYAGPGHVQHYLDLGGLSGGDLRPEQCGIVASLLLTQPIGAADFAERFTQYVH